MRAESTWTDAVVRAISDVAPNVRQVEFAPERGQAAWTVGSHIDIGVMVGGRADTRSYSLVGEPDAGCYRVAVKREEPSRGGSRFMWSLKPGSRISVSAPKNLFELQVGRPKYLLVAGGIGITPIVGMAQVLARRREKFHLYYCGRSRREMAYSLDLSERLGDRLEIFATDEGHRLNIAEAIAGLPGDTELYLCGPMRNSSTRRAKRGPRRDGRRRRCATRPLPIAAAMRPSRSGFGCRATASKSWCPRTRPCSMRSTRPALR